MNSFGEIVFSFGGTALRVHVLLLLFGQLYVLIGVFWQKLNLTARVLSVIQLFLGLGWFSILLDGSYYVEWVDTPRVYPYLVELIYGSPWIVVAAVNLVLTLVLSVCIYYLLRSRRTRFSDNTIKETLDMLPVGVCFAKEDGTVVLKNLKMEQLCSKLQESPLMDAEEFWKTVEKKSEAQNKARIVPISDSETVIFHRESIFSDGVRFTQITASDVSEEYRIISELRSKNKKLMDLQERIKAFSEMTTQLAMAEETLIARVTVHDEMGHLMLKGKYLLEHMDSADGEKLLELERSTHSRLTREGEAPAKAERDRCAEAINAVREIGVEVKLSGELPQGVTAQELLSRAIRECAANTVKHAGGDEVVLTITRNGGRIRAVLIGNGNPPSEPVVESGGLLNLRRSVEKNGGELIISAEPTVMITLLLNDK